MVLPKIQENYELECIGASGPMINDDDINDFAHERSSNGMTWTRVTKTSKEIHNYCMVVSANKCTMIEIDTHTRRGVCRCHQEQFIYRYLIN